MDEVLTKDLTDLLCDLGIESHKDYEYQLIIYNDDVNTMEFVMESLNTICKITLEDAFNVMLQAHYNGRAIVKKGDKNELLEMKNNLNNRQINADVEEINN